MNTVAQLGRYDDARANVPFSYRCYTSGAFAVRMAD